jgi:hypothetical protein
MSKIGIPDSKRPVELALKYTSSADVGTDAPPEPPEVSDQWVVSVVSHVPSPPTQYLFAIIPSIPEASLAIRSGLSSF